MKVNYPLLIILLLTLIIRLIFAFGWHEIWWDSGVYIGMGKYIYSAGENGLWENIRPPVLPIMLGMFWKIGLDPVLFGRLLEIAFMLGTVCLTYKLAKQWWEEKTAIIASLIVALSPIFYYLSFHQYTEIPSVFFVLLALWLFTKEKYMFAGTATGLAFLTKFYTGMFVVILLIPLLYSKKWKHCAHTITGFAIITAPYFVWSWIAYGSPLATFLAAQDAITRALGCNVLRYKPWWQYGWWLIFSETKLNILAILGIFALWKKWNKKYTIFVFSLAIPAVYLMQLHCRDYRYITLLIPFTAMLTGLGITWICDKINIRKTGFIVLVILLGLWMTHTSIRYYYGNEIQQPDPIAEEYFSYPSVKGEIWTSNPILAAYTDSKLEKIYYPIYDKALSGDFKEYVKANHNKIGAVFLDNCGGGIICPQGEDCQTEQLITELDHKFNRVFDKQAGKCWYRVWSI